MTAYIIKVILCSAVFIITYKLLLEKEKMFSFNRIYLLCCLLLSFAIPALTFTSSAPLIPILENTTSYTNNLQDNVMRHLISPEKESNYSFEILLTIYVTITTLLFFRLVKNLNRILSKARVHQSIPYKNASIILIEEDLTPHSFLNYLFINSKEYKNGHIENEILLHEYAHIRQKHSYDILLIEILQTVSWFNPFLFFYRKAIQLNHEFLADEAVVSTLNNVPGYQSLLIDKASKSQAYNLTSQFNYSIIKKRLLMMTKAKSSKKSLCRQIAVIPVLVVSIFLFSTQVSAKDTAAVTVTETKNNTVPSTKDGVSPEMLKEYEQIVSKVKNEKGLLLGKLSDTEKSRLQTIYLSMSKEQQAKQMIIFLPAPAPLPRVVPTEVQIESWKNENMYGVWINRKWVTNSTLNKYRNTDFAQVSVSKLGDNTVNYGKYSYQVNLITNEEYEIYYKKETEARDKYQMGVRMENREIIAGPVYIGKP